MAAHEDDQERAQITTERLCNVGKEIIKEGRYVGLYFYDLLIEALIDPARAPMELMFMRPFVEFNRREGYVPLPLLVKAQP